MTIDLIGWALIHSVWQGGAIAAALAGILWATRRMAPTVRYGVSLLALALMVILPVATVVRGDGGLQAGPGATSSVATLRSSFRSSSPATVAIDDIPRPAAMQGPATPDAIAAADAAAAQSDVGESPTAHVSSLEALRALLAGWIDRLLPWLVGVWLIGLVLLSARLMGGLAKARLLARLDTRPAADVIRTTALRLSERLGIRSAVRVLETSRAHVPLMVGWLQPVILLPASMLTGLSPHQLEMLLAHELAHVRRHDFAVNVLQTVVETLLFYHPAAWWIADRIREERENCCDDIAIAACGNDRTTYGATLVALEEWRGEATGLAAAATGGPLLRRVMRLLRSEPAHVDIGPRWLAGVVTVLAVLLTAGRSVALEASPSPLSESSASLAPSSEGSFQSSSQVQWRDTTRARPDTVIRLGGEGTLAQRWQAAEEQARAKRLRAFWIGYVVEGDGASSQWYFVDRNVPVLSQHGSMTGRMRFNGGSANMGLIFPGVPLAPLVGAHAPNDRALFFRIAIEGSSTRLAAVHLGSFALPVYFDRLPLLWLEQAPDGESLAQLRTVMSRFRDRELRGDLVAMMGAHRDSRLVVPLLSTILRNRSEDTGVRGDAAEWLADHATPQSLATLSAVARGDAEEHVQQEAIEALGSLKLDAAGDTLMLLARTLQSRAARAEAIESLGEHGDPRVIAFLDEFVDGSDDESLRLEALETLSDIPGGRGFDAVIAHARVNRDASIRRAAAEQIGNLEPTSRALDLLLEIVRRDVDMSVRTQAVETIADVPDPRALTVLRDVIDGESEVELQVEAVESLASTANPQEAVVELARLARAHPRAEVQHKAVEALGEIESADAVTRLVEIAETHPDVSTQVEAAETLGSAHPVRAAATAIRRLALNHPRDAVRKRALESLGEFADDPESQKTLIEIATRGTDSELQGAAIEALAGSTGTGRAAVASIARGDAPEPIRMKAIESYASEGSPREVVAFLKAIVTGDPSSRVRRMALETLSELDDDAGLATVREFARSSPDPRTREIARELLAER